MTEDFLHYVWKSRLYRNNLHTLDGEPVQVLDCGEWNTDAGPDFFNAKIRIGNTTWAGNIEMHVRAGDWDLHGHQHDQAYRNIILHVVYDAGRGSGRQPGQPVPLVELKHYIPAGALQKYHYLFKSTGPIPCSRLIRFADRLTISKWLERMLVERLELKTERMRRLLEANGGSWEETFYQCLARNFGFRLNAEPLEFLARSLPLKYILKQKDQLLQVEALLFGMAGLLQERFSDEYPNRLKAEFRFLQNKYGLQPLDSHLWKFARTRPMNFPTVRLAQLAMLLHRHANLLSEVTDADNTGQLRNLFHATPSEYWISHYRFDQVSRKSEKKPGRESVENILINTIAPFLFLYGKLKEKETLVDRSLEILSALPPESNAITKRWSQLGIRAANAFESQAQLQLKNNYCNAKKCLHCGIGMKILKAGSGTPERAAGRKEKLKLTVHD